MEIVKFKKLWLNRQRQDHRICRARYFSPSSWINNVSEFKNHVDAFRNKLNRDCKEIEDIAQHIDLNSNWTWIPEKEQVDLMKQIHQNLIFKISNAIDNVKKSRLGGFFSPRKLKNRIKLGKFERIVWSPVVARRHEMSPSNRNLESYKLNPNLVFRIISKNIATPDCKETTKTLKNQNLK